MIATDYRGWMKHEVLKMLHMTNVLIAIATFTTEIQSNIYDDSCIQLQNYTRYKMYHCYLCPTCTRKPGAIASKSN